MSVCIDSKPRVDQNCPDFEHVEVALYEAPAWCTEYEESRRAEIRGTEGVVWEIDVVEEGDEAFNRPFFDFLCRVLRAPPVQALIRAHASSNVRLGVQMLDSELNTTWSP